METTLEQPALVWENSIQWAESAFGEKLNYTFALEITPKGDVELIGAEVFAFNKYFNILRKSKLEACEALRNSFHDYINGRTK